MELADRSSWIGKTEQCSFSPLIRLWWQRRIGWTMAYVVTIKQNEGKTRREVTDGERSGRVINRRPVGVSSKLTANGLDSVLDE